MTKPVNIPVSAGVRPPPDATSPQNAAVLIKRLARLLDHAVAHDPAVRSGVLSVDTPSFEWTGARGNADPEDKRPMQLDDQFQIASITKMMTATTCMLLSEDKRLDLDVGIGRYLPSVVIDGLHVIDGSDRGSEITLRQLLSHTSGLADFFGDGDDAGSGSFPFLKEMSANPDRLWDPYDLVEWTKTNLSARFPPGKGWHYSDTGMLLAGLIIEHVTGSPFHRVLRERLFDPLDMQHTFLHFRETERPSLPWRGMSQAWVGDDAYGETRGVTADWACGGLVSTAADLKRFIRAFADDRIFKDPASRAQMLTWTPTGEPGVHYGLGIRRFDLAAFGFANAGELWGHTGFLKSFMFYWPQQDTTICGTLNQSAARGAFSELRPVAAIVGAVLGALL